MRSCLRHFRWEKDLSQRDLARESGVSLTLICSIEQGRAKNISEATAEKLSQALGVPAERLFPVEQKRRKHGS